MTKIKDLPEYYLDIPIGTKLFPLLYDGNDMLQFMTQFTIETRQHVILHNLSYYKFTNYTTLHIILAPVHTNKCIEFYHTENSIDTRYKDLLHKY